MKFLGTRLGQRERPAGRTRRTACTQRLRVRQRECRVSEAVTLTRTLSQRERD
jgi:hypothetical protein